MFNLQKLLNSIKNKLPPAFEVRDFRIFWVGAVTSATGSQFTTVAMAWQMYEITNSPLQIGMLGLFRAIAQIVLSLVGGLLADAVNRRRLMMVLEVWQALVCAALAILTFSGGVTPVTLYITALFLAIGTALESPPRQAIVPNLVPDEYVRSAVALNSVQRSVAMIIGPSLAGIVLVVAGPAWCYTINALMWVVMLIALLLVHLRPGAQIRKLAVAPKALLEGLAFVVKEKVILNFMILDFGATLFGSAVALYPVFAKDLLHVDKNGLGLMYAAPAVGAIITAFFISSRIEIRKTGKWVLLGVSLYAISTIAFAYSHIFWLSLLCLAGTGVGNEIGSVLRATTNQMLTPDTMRGRISAINAIFVMGGPQLGQFESGVVANIWGASMSAFSGGAGALTLVVGMAVFTGVRKFSLSERRRQEIPVVK